MDFHEPVLLEEVINYLRPKSGKKYIDATIGGGGHSRELLRKGTRVLGIDRDPEAVNYIRKNMKNQNLTLVQGNYSNIYEIAHANGFDAVDGILLDLGVSSHQLKSSQRGFSFQKNGPLDMRMEPELSISASDLINNFDERRLNEILKTFGHEKFSRSIASAICSARQIKPIKTTSDLSKIVQEVYEKKRTKTRLHPATKTFQALRIVVNSEQLNLEECLPQTIKLLRKEGRLAIISFHSLEDEIVKRFFKTEKRLKILTKKPIGPSSKEIKVNPRARSAKLRVSEKI